MNAKRKRPHARTLALFALAIASPAHSSEQVVGHIGTGSAIPPEGGLSRLGAVENLAANEDFLRSVVADPATGYAWFGTTTSPGQVIKVKYEGSGQPPRRVASLTLEPGEDSLFTAAVDLRNRFAYFGTFTSPGRVVKVALGDGDGPPTRIGAVTLGSQEDQLFASVLDSAAGHAYFGTRTMPGRVVKVALGTGNVPPSRIGAVTLASGENFLRSAVIDPASGHAWFGTFTLPGRVVKVALGAGASPPQRVEGIILDSGEDKLTSAVIDLANGEALFGTFTAPGRVVKIGLGTGTARLGAVTLDPGEDSLACASLGSASPGVALFGCDVFGAPATLVKVAFGPAGGSPIRVGAAVMESGEESMVSAADVGGAVFFGSNTQPGVVVQVAPGAGGQPPLRQSGLTLGRGENDLQSAVVDPASGYGWFGTATFPGQIIKVKLGSPGQPPQRIAAISLEPGEDRLTSAVGDIANGYAYFGTDTSPARVVKVALGAGSAPPVRIGALTLPPGEHNFRSAVIDPASGHAWFGTAVVQPGKIVKVALGTGNAPPTRTGATVARADEWDFQSAVVDSAGDYALFGTGQYFGETGAGGKIVKVALGAGGAAPARVSALSLPTGEEALHCAVADPASGYAWFGSGGPFFAQGSVVKVAFESGAAAPRRIGAALMQAGETPLGGAAIDVPAGYAVFGSGATRIIKVALGAGENPPTRVGGLELPPDENTLHCAGADAANGLAYFGTSTQPGQVVMAGYSQKGFIKGSRFSLPEGVRARSVRFFSHQAAGNVRLALYARSGGDRNLLWESAPIPNTEQGDWITVPVDLSLNPGDYDLAWQVDSTADVPGYIGGTTGDGFRVPAVFGSFPATLSAGAAGLETTGETWGFPHHVHP